MNIIRTAHRTISPRQVAVAAEAITAAQFALFEFDVLQQAGHARFFYDLVVAKSGGMMKINVFGSLTGFWNLVDSYVTAPPKQQAGKADYHRAIDSWLDDHSSRTCCLVQFESTELERMPRLYLASAQEIAARLHESTEYLGDPALYEQYDVTDAADGSHSIASVPAVWYLSEARIQELLQSQAEPQAFKPRYSPAAACAPCATQEPAACVQCLPMMA
jgi:hypothetical protein